MDFFGMGMGEVILVLIVAIIIFGPKRIPEIARTVGKTINAIRKASSDLTSQITKEIYEMEDEKKEHLPPSVIDSDTGSHRNDTRIESLDINKKEPPHVVTSGED